MRKILFALFLMVPMNTLAQTGTQTGDMEKMMQAVQKMQECMGKIDQAKLHQLENSLEELGQEIDMLCEQGKRDLAQSKSLKVGKRLMENPTMKQMQKCSKQVEGLIPSDSQESPFGEEFDESKGHVCDSN